MLLSGVILISGVAQTAISAQIVFDRDESITTEQQIVVEIVKSPCGKIISKRIVVPDCSDSGCDTDCSLCLYGLISQELLFARFPSTSVPDRTDSYLSVPNWPLPRPPTA